MLEQSLGEIDVVIRAAIVERIAVRAVYGGRERLLCPHMLGRNKDGQVLVLCLQIGGDSASGLQGTEGGNWRCLALEKFSGVERTAAVWQSTSGSLRPPKCMDQVELSATDPPEREPQNGH